MTMRRLVSYGWIGRVLMIPGRAIFILAPRWFTMSWRMVKWLFTSKEYYNYSGDLTHRNTQYLVEFLENILGLSIKHYIKELNNDYRLHEHLKEKGYPKFGIRVAWYCIIRALKPRIVVETGVDMGLGTSIICAALRRNNEEGFNGHLYATEVREDCGQIIPAYLKEHYTILEGDSIRSLERFHLPIDLFIHDSDHRELYELSEYVAIQGLLLPTSFVLSDNSKHSTALLQFTKRVNGVFYYFQDEFVNHWWQGDGLGLMFFK